MTAKLPLALAFPLRGSQLIEASAGTGKTFTISALYLRLVLGHGDADSGFGRELLPPQILVVTFTDAATKELRDRIRTRLAQAARFFRDETPAPDTLIAELREQYRTEQWPGCANRLDIAAQWMDEAAVSTIHSWCQRMLREHAFDSGSLFTQSLETDHSDLLGEVVRDYWRRYCYPMQGDALNWVRANWGGPAALLARVRGVFDSERESVEGTAPAELIAACLQARREALVALKAPWGPWARELREICLQGVASKTVDGRKMQARYFEPWFEKISAWAEDETVEDLDIGTGFTRLTPDGMAEAWKGPAPEHPGLHAMAALPASLDALPTPDAAVLKHAAQWIGERFEEEKRRRAEMGFDDMLLRLRAALQAQGGERLATLIREQFPVALIDEFQDTDPVQYRIFESIYRIEDNNPECGLFLIGDPKQAIYAFRGADIYTYLRARQATSGRLHTLDTNFRSSHGMVRAVNHVFQQAELREQGRGAFLFREPDGDNPVPFSPVQSQGRKESLEINGQPVPALNVWQLGSEQPLSGAVYRQQLAAACASEISALLNAGQQGQAGFVRDAQVLKGLLPADIAILVRDGKEAQAVRSALSARGVRSVYLSDKDSVFAAQEAHDLLSWLKACAEPDVERPLRAALASITLNLSLIELERLNQDELAWERRVMQFREYRQIWRLQGVLPMLRRLLHDFELPQALIARSDGERVLTNLLHLSELLQQAAAELDGEQALIRHLGEHLALSGQAGEEQILRLESDEQLVKVVTIHKSKGLEYPLVFLPFICSAKPVDGSRLPLHYHDERGRPQVSLSPTPELIALADHERLAEDLRLLYVALTRAQHACWLGVADLKRGNHNSSVLHLSALGYLLGGGERLAESADLQRWLRDLQQGCDALSVGPMPQASDLHFHPPRNEAVLLAPLIPRRRAAENWWIASYSALRVGERLSAASDEAPESAQAQKLFDDERLDPHAPREVLASGGDIHRFPRGPNPGTFLHGLLEWAGDEGFKAEPKAIEKAIGRRCNRRGWEGWITTLSDWLGHLLQVPLRLGGEPPLVLAQLSQYRVEMEFWFASHQVDVLKLDELVRQYTHAGAPRMTAESALLNGMFKGFIDLSFEHAGRYYVADYKSNWLGAEDGAYTEQAMEQSMLDHRYDLQYALYLLALHRQLKARLVDYDYDRHMGGAVYLFLRGTRSTSQGVYFARPPRELIERLDRLFQGKPEPKAPVAWEQGVLL
ncbi:DNA helicase/exodeoxyribonuclease V, beta subunit [Pseudomonas sp. ok272]|uniref:exodeoxyribonuclease V subunit beta n=1 Tax=unclassified Pseudomonas TaxID=196821 RepID=UPI0008C02EBF|nr:MULTISPECIES: exodeoxyribonuclease V subunit beta [unclassified Pseudomonas]SEN57827.1 DNA helicase/exodeoxyribonuclease V, beta subunit [Pseudomonas sp. ok272]SFN36790.1 DNA helicase/exodeoxyribonuclease V, beta subunit [Pseudomonas sp. ok602]